MPRALQSSGGRVITTLADMEGNESFDPECLGDAEEVSEERVGDGELIFVKGTKVGSSISCRILYQFSCCISSSVVLFCCLLFVACAFSKPNHYLHIY